MEKSIHMDKITLGVCYYPEHWPETLWENDLERMKEHGLEVVRVAEFAWTVFEPEEGDYRFDFFDRFLDLAHSKGIRVIFCTPTATPPAWLTYRYPEVLNANLQGDLMQHGMRRHYNYNSAVYHDFTRKIVTQLASHYGEHPAVVGWQIDNEFNCEINEFYSQADHQAFRRFLRERFKTLEALNEAMGTVFWNQTYTAWEQLYLTRTNVHNASNPHLALEEKRFISYSTNAYCKMQSDILRSLIPSGQFITTNGIFGHVDTHEMTRQSLDFMTYDSYPNFAFGLGSEPLKQGNINDRNWAWHLTKTRSMSPNFGIMEQQSGGGGWDIRMRQPQPKPGQMRLWTFQSIAHGADYISYFRWRTCWVGTEIYWHGLNNYDNLPNRRLAELSRIHRDVTQLQGLPGSRYVAGMAIIKDYDNEWDGEQDAWHGPMDKASDSAWFSACQLTQTPVDFVFLGRNGARTTLEELQRYALLVYPHAVILTRETADLLKAYVDNGGKLVMGARTGYKDEYGRCPMHPAPGYAADICGVRVTDSTLLGPADGREYVDWEGDLLEATEYNDILEPLGDTRVAGTFRGNYYEGAPALTVRQLGQGEAWYFGGGFSQEGAKIFLKKLGMAAPWKHVAEVPECVELTVREKNGEQFMFLLNYSQQPVNCRIHKEMKEVLTDSWLCGEISLPAYGVMVLSDK